MVRPPAWGWYSVRPGKAQATGLGLTRCRADLALSPLITIIAHTELPENRTGRLTEVSVSPSDAARAGADLATRQTPVAAPLGCCPVHRDRRYSARLVF